MRKIKNLWNFQNYNGFIGKADFVKITQNSFNRFNK